MVRDDHNPYYTYEKWENGEKKVKQVIICSACKAVYVKEDGCPNNCMMCAFCKCMTHVDNLNLDMLMGEDLECCIDCYESEGKDTPKPQLADWYGDC